VSQILNALISSQNQCGQNSVIYGKPAVKVRSAFNSKQTTVKQVNIGGVFTFPYTGSFLQIVWSLQRILFCQYNLAFGQLVSDVFHSNR
jgi:hypothetical protein